MATLSPRCLDSRALIQAVSGVADVEIIVVSDGSTDKTAEIAGAFDHVKVVVFEKNRGYGAAIKEGWRQGKGTLLGFLDADGTCDPDYFGEMCRAAIHESADVVLGSRLGPDSKMPRTRRLGNRNPCVSAWSSLRPARDGYGQRHAGCTSWFAPLPLPAPGWPALHAGDEFPRTVE